jgi:hypothetical protein
LKISSTYFRFLGNSIYVIISKYRDFNKKPNPCRLNFFPHVEIERK